MSIDESICCSVSSMGAHRERKKAAAALRSLNLEKLHPDRAILPRQQHIVRSKWQPQALAAGLWLVTGNDVLSPRDADGDELVEAREG